MNEIRSFHESERKTNIFYRFFGVQEKFDTSLIYKMIDASKKLDLNPNRVCFGDSKGSKNKRLILNKSFDRNLAAIKLGDWASIDVSKITNGDYLEPNSRIFIENHDGLILHDTDDFENLNQEFVCNSVVLALEIFNVIYGFIWRDKNNLKGQGIVHGMCTGTLNASESKIVSAISAEGQRLHRFKGAKNVELKYETQIVDVFEYNIVSEKHMAFNIDSKTLREWIVTGNRGHITELPKQLFLWTVPVEQIEQIRNELLPLGLLMIK